ncbi:MAG: cation-translocating P-type ATPase [Saprospiraceae bacterium]|nr:cation-translocating P-type ATPase [Saprospiraceae bacterium]
MQHRRHPRHHDYRRLSCHCKSIGARIGLPATSVLTGSEMEAMDDAALAVSIKDTHIFARIIPEQKLRLVNILKANGEVVAMTGDGVNDAPALKAADIGIAMGNKGTDVARESASLVLLDDNFASIVTAIRLGRRIYDNLQKAMSYILAIHIPIIGLTVLPAFNPTMPLLLLPLHIILMELIIDPVCSVAFEFEKDERGIMKRPPRDPKSTFFGRQEFIKSVGQGLLLLIMVSGVYFSSFREGHTDGQARMIAFFALIIGNLFLIFTNLSKTRTILDLVIRGNKEVFVITGVVAAFVAMLTLIPALRELMSFELPKYFHFTTTIAGSLIIMSLMELMKLWKGRGIQK